MTSRFLTLSSVISLTLCACEPPKSVDPAADYNEDTVINSHQPGISQTEPRRVSKQQQVSGTRIQEPIMPQPDPKTTPPPAKPAAPPPRRVILPSPIQPPAEIDPVQPYPGDEVPR